MEISLQTHRRSEDPFNVKLATAESSYRRRQTIFVFVRILQTSRKKGGLSDWNLRGRFVINKEPIERHRDANC